jgi:hypothetical protein
MHRDFPCRRSTNIVSLLPVHNRRADDALRCKPQLETLEPRNLMTASPGPDWSSLISHQGCNCSLCTGQGLNQIVNAEPTGAAATSGIAFAPLTSLPQLSSNSNASAKLFLDFNGHTQAAWGSYTNVVTPVYDQDGDRTTFSTGELTSIQQIWARVAEDFAPYNIDVTTIDPGNSTNGVTARIAIGGNWSDWFNNQAGGVAYIGGFYNGAPNVGYVFEDALSNGNARFVAEATSHEAGHLFGLLHQSTWSGNTLVDPYSEGTAELAPIMGVGYYSQRTTWHNGATDDGPTAYQDDMAILANGSNGFGYRTDDFGSSLALASGLVANGGAVSMAGLIGSNSDQDWFTFDTAGGAFNLTVNVASLGANLDSVLELRNSSGTIIVTANPTTSLSATISTTLASGTYFVVVRSSGGYGNVGQYTLTGTAPVNGSGGGGEDTSAPEINVLNGTLAVQSGGSISFGSVQVGNGVNKILTVRNTGTGPLTLTPLTNADLPAGFSIVTNFASTTLAAGASATITLRYAPTAAGATSGTLTLLSDDADEGSFVINLTGTATPAPAPEINVLNGTVAVQSGGAISFGDVQVTKFLNKVITIKNTGNATLTLVKPTAADMPAGFSIVTNFVSTSLAAGASATITIRYTPTAVGAAGGVLNLVSNDADEGMFAINLAGTGTPAPAPEINVNVGTLGIQTGGTVDFGNVQVGKTLNKVITIKNTGPGTLTLVKPTAADMPAGFSIVTNFTVTSLAVNASATITLRYTPTALGAAGGLLNLISNDADEGTFAINLTGTGTPGPAPEINVNVGTLVVQTGGNVDFGNVQVSKYLDKTITVKNTGPGTLTLVKPTAADMPAGFTIITNFTVTSLAANASATIKLRYTPSAIGAAGGVLNLVSNDADEGTFAINLTGTGTPGPTPEINVNIGTLVVQSGGAIDFGNVAVGQFANQTITVKNTGTAALTLVKPTAAQLPAGFSIVTNFVSTSLAVGASATITLRYTPTAIGASGGVLNLVSNDSDEGTFALNLTGTGTPAPIIRAIDNGAAGFTTTGAWTRVTYQGREADIQTALKGTGTTTATWTFTSLPPGQYRVHASWTANVTNATNAPFTVFDGVTEVGTVLANQEVASSGLNWSSTNWKELGTFDITGDTIRVTLTNAANDRVVADAVRVERIGDLPEPEGAAAAGALPSFSLPVGNTLPLTITDSTPTTSGNENVFAPLTSSFSLIATPLPSSSVDEVFAAAGDAQAELLLLNNALDLLCIAEDTLASGSDSETEEATDALLTSDWLVSEGQNLS